MFGAVAQAVTSVTDAYQQAAQSGATFSGSVNEFSAAATSAGMTMEKFGALISQNAFGMGAFGTTAEDGAKNFAKTSKALRASASDLYALGYSTQQINEGLAKYGSLMRSQGQQGKMSNDQLAAGAKNYMKELDLLAKATGEDRKTIEARQAAMALDAQFQASMAGLGPKVRDSFMAVATGVPKDLESFTKDIMANGVATTDENQKLMAMLPKSAAMLAEFNAKTQRGEAVTLEERNRLNNLLATEGPKSLQNIKYAGAAQTELTGVVKGLASTATINTDALKKGAEQQTEAQKKTDAMNKAVEESKQKLAEFSNKFQMALANSGMLDTLMKAFEFTANFVMQYVVPLFSVLATSIGRIVGALIDGFAPAVEGVGGFFNGILLPAIQKFTDFLVVDLIPAVASAFDTLKPVIDFVADTMKSLAMFITENLTAVLIVVGGALTAYYVVQAALTVIAWAKAAADSAALMAVLGFVGGILLGTAVFVAGLVAAAAALAITFWPITLAVVALVAGFKALYNSGWTFGNAIDAVKDNLQRLWLTLTDWMNGLLEMLPNALGGISKEEATKRREITDATRKELDDNEKARDAERKGIAKKREDEKKESENTKKSTEVDKKVVTQKEQHAKALGTANAKEVAAKEEAAAPKVDYNANGADLLKQYATASGSGLIKDQKPAATTGAETVKKTIEADGEKKTADAKAAVEKKAADEKKQAEDAKEGEKKPATQESAETLLAELNTKMAQLIKFSAQTTTNTYETFNAAKGLQGNLFKR
jgi:hypothetical protein